MQEYLNKNPLNNYKSFKEYANEKIVGLNLNILPNENFFKNIYYPWKKANLSFKWYSIFQNNKTKINKIKYFFENFNILIYLLIALISLFYINM